MYMFYQKSKMQYANYQVCLGIHIPCFLHNHIIVLNSLHSPQ